MFEKNKYMEYEDLVSYGMIGLMDAIKKYDSTKGMKFSSYASIRIKGSMIDELRKNRPISKGAMDKLNKYNKSIDELQLRLLREPNNKEIADYMGITTNEVAEIENYINLYYYEGLTLKEIGTVLSVSESRVCQLHSRAIKNLRDCMKRLHYID